MRSPPSLCGLPLNARPTVSAEEAVAHPYPLRARGLDRDELRASYGDSDQSDWWDVALGMGPAPTDSEFCAARRALFESFVPIERGSAPAYRRLICSRAAAPLGSSVVDHEGVRPMGFETVSSIRKLESASDVLGDLLRLYLDGIPQSAVLVISVCSELVGPVGPLEP